MNDQINTIKNMLTDDILRYKELKKQQEIQLESLKEQLNNYDCTLPDVITFNNIKPLYTITSRIYNICPSLQKLVNMGLFTNDEYNNLYQNLSSIVPILRTEGRKLSQRLHDIRTLNVSCYDLDQTTQVKYQKKEIKFVLNILKRRGLTNCRACISTKPKRQCKFKTNGIDPYCKRHMKLQAKQKQKEKQKDKQKE